VSEFKEEVKANLKHQGKDQAMGADPWHWVFFLSLRRSKKEFSLIFWTPLFPSNRGFSMLFDVSNKNNQDF